MKVDRDNLIDFNQIIEEVGQKYPTVNSEKVVLEVVHRGDLPTSDLLMKMDIQDLQVRQDTRDAIFSVREQLNIHAE